MENEKASVELSLMSSHDEVENVRTFVFERKNLQWAAGQSQAYVLPLAGGTEEENQHWFTIASAPVEGTVHISTRISSSPFKKALNALKPGEKINAHSLGGKFIWEEDDDTAVTLVAAGIGITPFRSILLQRSATAKPLNATLLYFNRTDAVPFQKELEELAQKHPGFTMKLVIGEPITAEKILSMAPNTHGQVVYLSGPAPMVSSIGTALKEAGVAIKQDRFPGYDESNF
jgi:ferredoxin-NADP reductase